MSITDQQLRNYIDQIFQRYDRDRSGTLTSNELVHFFNDMFQMMNSPRRVTQWEAEAALREIDLNSDGQASKQELFLAFKQILNVGQTQNYGGYGQQNKGYGNQQPYQQQGGYNQQPPPNQGWGNNQGWNNNQGGYGNNQGYNSPQNQGWGNQPQNTGWGQPSHNQGWGQSPQQNYGGWGNQQPNYQKNWGSSTGW